MGEKCPHIFYNPLDISLLLSFLKDNRINKYNIEIDRDYSWQINDPDKIQEYLDFLNVVGGAWQLMTDERSADAINRELHKLIKEHIEKHQVYSATRTRVAE